MKKTVLITGASKGIGKSLALRFKEKDFFVIGVSRSDIDYDIDLKIKADLTNETDRKNLVNGISEIDILINNAGVGMYESWENTDIRDLRYLFELNFFSVVDLTLKLIPNLKKNSGSIINISSVAGKLYVPYMGGYCASKYALNAFSYSLKAELHSYNIHVMNVIVGRINTGFSNRALGSLKPPKTPFGGSVEKLADVIYRGYLKKKREIWYPNWYRYFVFGSNIFNGIYDKLALKNWEKK
ncbi:SDR family NAD(P)-dependent oxidoreductase [Persephonella sp.]